LLQVHIAQEETKFGMDEAEISEVFSQASELKNVRICGLMGMASLSGDMEKVRGEFIQLRNLLDKCSGWSVVGGACWFLSIGMSGDYKIAVEEGSTMVRIGSLLFGERKYN
jgi:hypothetical protein